MDDDEVAPLPHHLVQRARLTPSGYSIRMRPSQLQDVASSPTPDLAGSLPPPLLVADVILVSPRASRLSQMKRACLGSRLVVAACQMVAGVALLVSAAVRWSHRRLAAGGANVAIISLVAKTPFQPLACGL